MGRPQYGAHPDANQRAIVEELRLRGYQVAVVSDLPVRKSFCDLYVWGVGASGEARIVGVEVKSERGRLTKSETAIWEALGAAGLGDGYIIARSVEDVLDWFNKH